MAEYIEREEAKRIVDDIDTWSSGWRNYAKLQMDAIPAADVIQIVRCKDCRYQHACAFDAYDDFYCASGKRKGGGAK